MRENRSAGLMRGGKSPVIGSMPFNPSLPAYFTKHEAGREQPLFLVTPGKTCAGALGRCELMTDYQTCHVGRGSEGFRISWKSQARA
jgi:hypothetical protein